MTKLFGSLKSTRWVTLLLFVLVWTAVGFAAGQWNVFQEMTWPMVSLGGAFIIGKSWRPSMKDGANV